MFSNSIKVMLVAFVLLKIDIAIADLAMCKDDADKAQICCVDDPMSCIAGIQTGADGQTIGQATQAASALAPAAGAAGASPSGEGGMQGACEMAKIMGGLGAGTNGAYAAVCKVKKDRCIETCGAVTGEEQAEAQQIASKCEKHSAQVSQATSQAALQALSAAGGLLCQMMTQQKNKEKKPEDPKDPTDIDCNNPKYALDGRCLANKPSTVGNTVRPGGFGNNNAMDGSLGDEGDQGYAGHEFKGTPAAASAGVQGGGGGGGPSSSGGSFGGPDYRGGGEGSIYNADVMDGTQSVSGGGGAGAAMTTTEGGGGGGSGGANRRAEDPQIDISKFFPKSGGFGSKDPSRSLAGVKMVDGITAANGASLWEKVSRAIRTQCTTLGKLTDCKR